MSRLAPLAAALALSLAGTEAFARPTGPVPSAMSSWTAPGYAQPGVAAEPAPAPEPAPQPYADPSQPAPAPAPAPAPQPYADPAGQVQPAPGPPMPRSRRKGLMIAGWTMFGASYLATAFIAAIVHDTCNLANNPRCQNAATLTIIPAIGPFLAIPYVDTDSFTLKALMAFPGLIQIAGLTMGIVGTVQFVRDGREPRYVGVDGFKLGPKRNLRLGMSPTRFLDGGTVHLGYRF